MAFNPLQATGMLYVQNEHGDESFAGSCFLFREDNVVLTAAHCVPPSIAGARIMLSYPKREMPVLDIRRHPSADIAVLVCGEEYAYRNESGYPETAFWDGVNNWSLGEGFNAFGYPSEGPSFDAEPGPTPRFFAGYFQRFFRYGSHSGYQYLAGELSIPAPGGLSGGPIFRPGAAPMVTGLVTANAESYAVTDSIDDVQQDGTRYRQESRRVLTYGVALMLSEVGDWLHVEVPNPTGRAWVLPNPLTGDTPDD